MKLCVLLGGPSAEREVSLMSGSAMARALEALGHDVTLLDPATNRAMKLSEFHADPPNTNPPSADDLGATGQGATFIESLLSQAVRDADAVVLGLHGVPGEDGLVQSVLESIGKPYTGSTSRVSAVCIDKELTKYLIERVGSPVPRGATARRGTSEKELRDLFGKLRDDLGLPLVIKPNDQGSTVGLTILKENDAKTFVAAVQLSWQYSQKALIEEFIDGRELTVAVLDSDRGLVALPIVEIAPEGGFYDYHHKYTKGMTVYTCPAELPTELSDAIRADAIKVFEACEARGYSRIDYRLRPDGSYFCLEINTLPGMTATSLVPKAAAAAGMSFEQLCDRILSSAFMD